MNLGLVGFCEETSFQFLPKREMRCGSADVIWQLIPCLLNIMGKTKAQLLSRLMNRWNKPVAPQKLQPQSNY